MKLWEYFEQEVKKSHVAVNVKNKVLKALGMDSLALQQVSTFMVLCRDFNGIYHENLYGSL